MTLPCDKEGDLGYMRSQLKEFNRRQAESKVVIDKIFDLLNGKDGTPGLKTQVALNKQSISRLWKSGVSIATVLTIVTLLVKFIS